MTTTEHCWDCGKPAKYRETSAEYERSDGTKVHGWDGGTTTTRERPWCGIHAPSKVKARTEARVQRRSAARLAELRAKATLSTFTGGWRDESQASATLDGEVITVTSPLGTFTAAGMDGSFTLLDTLRAMSDALHAARSALNARAQLAHNEQIGG